MPRSSRTQTLLLGVFAVLLLVSAGAFAFTFESQLAWQHRDAVTTAVTDVRVVAGGETSDVAVNVAVENPTGRAVTLVDAALVVYDGASPFEDDRPLSVPRTASVPRTTVPAGATETVTVTARVENETRARRAIARGDATPSGTFEMELRGRGFSVDV